MLRFSDVSAKCLAILWIMVVFADMIASHISDQLVLILVTWLKRMLFFSSLLMVMEVRERIETFPQCYLQISPQKRLVMHIYLVIVDHDIGATLQNAWG